MKLTSRIRTMAVCATSILSVSGTAFADGMPRAKDKILPAPQPVVESAPASRFDGCYVRTDVGYGWAASDHATATITPAGYGPGTGRVQGANFDGAWFGEVGFGCSFVRQSMVGGSIKDAAYEVSTPTGFRGDITFGFHGSRDFKGIPVSPPAPPATPPAMIDPVHAKLQSNTLMFNLYYDLPTMHAFTPYVGAGIGMAFVDLSGVTFTNGVVVRVPGNDQTNLAWSLMAGVATDIGRGMKLDLGYRYLNMGDIAASSPVVGYSLKLNDVSEHQFKIGLRIPVSF